MDIGICLNDANIFFCSPEDKELTILYCKGATILRAKRDNTED